MSPPTPTTCAHCGLPMRVRRAEPGRRHYCCSGCAFLARMPAKGSDQFPITPALIAGLAGGFVFFNQLLFWLGSFLLGRESGRETLAANLGLVSILCGGGIMVFLAVTQWKSGSTRAGEFIVFAIIAALFGLALARHSPALAVMATTLLSAWCGRGLLRATVNATIRG